MNENKLKNGFKKMNGITETCSLVKNPYLKLLKEDILYHLGFSTNNHNFEELFGDVKFVCMGGTNHRMEEFAYFMREQLNLPDNEKLENLTENSHRFAMFKVGPVLSVSHGMGMPSLSILLNEIIKLCHYSKVKDPIFIRIGTCGGIGVKPGTIVVTQEPLNYALKNVYENKVMNKIIERPAILNQKLAKEIVDLADPNDDFDVVSAKTLGTDDFYEGQGRLDGAFCDYTEKEREEFLINLYNIGVRNIEMEATAFASFTHLAGIRAAVVCCTFIDRLQTDQVLPEKKVLLEWTKRPQKLVSKFIKNTLINLC